MKKRIVTLLCALFAAACLFGVSTGTAAEQTIVLDPSFNLIGGGSGDMALVKEDGTVELQVTPTAGFGFRANATQLGEANLVDVKDFTTTFTLTDVPVNVTTIFGLQTIATGTIGGGNGNAINFMFRRDAEDKVAVAIYNAAASEPAYWAPGKLALDATKKITITLNYEAANNVTLQLGDAAPIALPTDIIGKEAIDEHYAEAGFKAYYSVSSYYFTPPATTGTVYTVDSINGKTPVDNYKSILLGALTKFEDALKPLTIESPEADILAAGEFNVFGADSAYSKLIPICDDENGSIASRVAAATDKMDKLGQKAEYTLIAGQIAAFSTALDAVNENAADTVDAALAAFEAIDRETLATLDVEYRTALEERIDALKTGEKFKTVIGIMTERYVKSYEDQLADGDAASYATYREISRIVTSWDEYKTENYVGEVLEAEAVQAFDTRVAAMKTKLEKSFYASMWSEGETWDAIKSDKGLYATGEGKYNETLGFNQKLEVGKNAKIEFNIIYALRKLGANHLHIGFYPKTGTGTRGESDGVRVDFWFSAQNTVEIKPVNGKTETQIFSGAFITTPDTGFFDIDAEQPDYTQGAYTVELLKNGDALSVRVNGQEMDITGLDASLFSDGCYITVSTMSVPGTDPNELLITKVGDVSYIGSGGGGEEPGPTEKPQTSTQPGDGTAGCGCGTLGSGGNKGWPILLISAAAFTAILFVKRRGTAR